MINLQLYFPTVIGNSYQHELRDELLPIVKDILADDDNITNEWGYKNTYNGHQGLEKLSEMTVFTDFIKEAGSNYLQQLGYEDCPLDPVVFASEMHKGDSHDRHCHPGALLSGVFYLDCPTGSSDIMFFDPRNFRDVRALSRVDTNIFTSDSAIYSPEDGLFLIWESWIHHQVSVNNSDTGRITLVFNA